MNNDQIFNKEFLNLDCLKISDEIRKNGFFCLERALSENFLKNILNDVQRAGLSLNTNNVAGVYFTHGTQFFITHMLAVSKNFFNYCTDNKFLDISKNFLGETFRLKALRYYENLGGQHMQWHTDNRYYDENIKGEIESKNPGLIFLSYISDVEDGEFQYVRGSHLWSKEIDQNDYSDEYIGKNYANDIVGFKKPRGSILIYNTCGIHRAKPTKNKKFKRRTLFFQVEKELNHSEPILVKTEFLNKFDDTIKMYLGFGRRAGQKIYPTTSLDTMPFNKATSTAIFRWLAGRFANIMPGFLRKRIRKILKIKTNIDYNE